MAELPDRGAKTETNPWSELLQLQEYVKSIDPLGIPKPYMGTTAPANHILSNNKVIRKTTAGGTDYLGSAYEALYKVLHATASTTNAYGHWVTGRTGSAQDDWDADRPLTLDYRGAVLRAIGTGTGWTETTEENATLALKQNDAIQGHDHGIPKARDTGNDAGFYDRANLAGDSPYTTSMYNDGTNGDPRIAKETRMKNIGVNIIFRYQ